ncbi:MAG: terminase large subunit domain-containing protein [Phycisphaerae bacterium]
MRSRREPARPKPVIELLAYQRADVESDARFQWNCWARQTGKSFTKSLRRILRGLLRGRDQIFLSAGERQCKALMQKAKAHCQVLQIAAHACGDGMFRGMSVSQLEIALPGGVRIIGLPANPNTARGFTGDVLLDEFAMHADAREIWAAMFPTLLRGGGELDVASTPRGTDNAFYELSQNRLFRRSTITLPDAIAAGLDADADALREAMADDVLFRQEFLCEFLDGSTALMSSSAIEACTDAALAPACHPDELIHESRELFAGVDVGRLHDLTVMWVLAKDDGAMETVAMIELRSAPFGRQSKLLDALMGCPTLRRCCIDAGGLGMQLAEQAVERFGDHRVEAVTFTPAVKMQLAGGLRHAIQQRRMVIPNDKATIADFSSVQRTVTSSGQFRLTAPRREGSHADRFWAAALAVRAVGGARGDVSYVPGRPIQFAREGVW